jgi:2Fe-2S iron-sulfur cluster binding domain
MTFTGSVFRGSKLVAATALALGLLTTASFAYTQEQQQLCTGDAMRLCSLEIPDVDRVTACMIAKRAQLSDGCKSVFRKMEPAPTPATYAPTGKPHQPLNIAPHKRG